ncbi:hypothetical protein WDW37_11400 [Bdellovibrionota bacterium FG-1]
MELLTLQSEDAFYFYLKKFLKAKPDAVQLDGSTRKKENKKFLLVFTYSVDGRKYKVSGEFSRKAAEAFVHLTEEHGSSAIVLKEYSPDGKQKGLILATSKKPDGFHCYAYTAKASHRLGKAA